MDLEQRALERIRLASEMSLRYYDKPLICTYSGGKDSDVLLELFIRSGISFEVQNSHTTADAPETVRHIRGKFRELEMQGIKAYIEKPTYKGEPISMWKLIPIKLMPPTRMVRYCCQVLKETGCANRYIATGVRWDESTARSERKSYEIIGRTKKEAIRISDEVMLMNDNTDKRRMIEKCELKAKTVVNPIIDWTTRDVWDFIGSEKISTNSLYKCGFDRVGCIGCPLASKKKRIFEFSAYPQYKTMYTNAFRSMIEVRKSKNMPTEWITGRDVFNWWIEEAQVPGQMEIEDFL